MTSLVILQPPKFGDPCNHCGRCCKEEACRLSVEFYGEAITPCPSLQQVGNQYFCGMFLMLSAMAPKVAKELGEALGFGRGCCADFSPSKEQVNE
jgi:hypothetical protein